MCDAWYYVKPERGCSCREDLLAPVVQLHRRVKTPEELDIEKVGRG